MRLDVAFSPHGLPQGELTGRVVFVIDILRATTVMCAAIHHGARAVVPVASTEDALRLAQTLDRDDALLAGERNGVPIPGFQLGNSPREMTPEAVAGRTLVMTTTNGTRALVAVQHAEAVYVAAAANLSAVGAMARSVWEDRRDLLILCAGREQVFSLDDAYAAGRLVVAARGGRRGRKGLNDAALASLDLVRRYRGRWDRPLLASRAGRDLVALGFKEDVLDAAREDAYPVLLQYQDRRVTRQPDGPTT